MKVPTIRQPYAAAIMAGLKTVEYRTWYTRHRGPLLVHAGARRPTSAECGEYPGLDPRRFVYGAIVGAVDVTDCVEGADGYEWLLARPRPLAEPVPCKGVLGLWDAPPGVVLP
jgi:hypothetical protein